MSGASAAQIAARLDRIPASRTLWTIVVLISLGGAFEFCCRRNPPNPPPPACPKFRT